MGQYWRNALHGPFKLLTKTSSMHDPQSRALGPAAAALLGEALLGEARALHAEELDMHPLAHMILRSTFIMDTFVKDQRRTLDLDRQEMGTVGILSPSIGV